MSLTRANFDTTPVPQPGRAPTGARYSASDWPDWIIVALNTLRAKFAAPADGRGEWTSADAVAYARILGPLGEIGCARVVQIARERHHWRPSVAQVREIADETRGQSADLNAAEIAARTPVRRPKALPSPANGPGRQEFRAVLDRMREGRKP